MSISMDMSMSREAILQVKGMRKEFPGVLALENVDFSVQQGEVRALVGENGAGKSTLIKILTGVYQPDGGELLFKGRKTTIAGPLAGQQMGISVVHQELNLIEDLSICENIFLGRPLLKKAFPHLIDWQLMNRESSALLERLKVALDVGEKVKNLSVAQKQIVEIAKALSYNCEIMIMDEPSATLTENELQVLFDVIFELKRQGVTIIYISHRLEEIFKIADTVTVLRDGRHIVTGKVADTDRSELIRSMVGRSMDNEYPKRSGVIGDTLLEVSHFTSSRLKDVSLQLKSGEILGVAGLVGAGRTELARAIFGADRKDGGTLLLRGTEEKIHAVSDAVRKGLGLVPEERKNDGLVLGMTLRENISLTKIEKVENSVLLSPAKELKLSNEYIQKLRIITPGPEQLVKNLSGGNQQKVVLAKWLVADSDILIFDEPTRGIDVGAKYEIYLLLNELVQAGKSIIMISSELPELLGMSDRIIVMHEGKITGELSREEADQEKIMNLAAG